MKIEIESIKGLNPLKTYVVEVRKNLPRRYIQELLHSFRKLNIAVLIVPEGDIKFIEPSNGCKLQRKRRR